jgi:DNA repair protein RecN (Recombination protein N)
MIRLRRCTIEDVGLIARAELAFSDGLTVFSGETGSGKTMLLGALKLALGERASPDLVARGAAAARVTLEIEPDDALRARFAGDGFDLEPDEDAIFVRELQRGGKSSARINGRPATAAQLRGYGEALVDFVGQHEQQRLLSGTYQTDLLDRFAGSEALELRERIATGYARAAELEVRLREFEEHAGRALAEAEFARFAAAEIAEAHLSEAEEGDLRERRAYLQNAERIAGALRGAREALVENEGAASETLGAVAASLAGIARYAEPLARLAERATALQSDATDLAIALVRESDRTGFDPAENEQIGERLDAIARLQKKYGDSIAAVLAAGEGFAATAAAYDARDERSARLRGEHAECCARLDADAERLGALRAKAARRLEERIAAELAALAMKHARFSVLLQRGDAIGPRGRERVEFLLAPNRGEEPRSLARAASGGELSRVLLALIVVLANRTDGAALVFDEIDAGIGGATANAVALRLGALAGVTQVLCVTHLAQIASWADLHVALRKREARGATRIDAFTLGSEEILEEIARMLSGSTTAVALEHAEALVRAVRSQKRPALRTA